MIRGHLHIYVMKLLQESPMTGYRLMGEIESTIGSRPSPGSIYPLLDSLSESGLIKLKEEGRKKIYSLTSKGKRKLNKIKGVKKEILDRLNEGINLLENICEGNEPEFFRMIIDTVKNDKVPFSHLNPEIWSRGFRARGVRQKTGSRLTFPLPWSSPYPNGC